MDFEDKRVCPRYEVSYKVSATLDGRELGSTIIDISEMGVGIMLSKNVSLGNMLEVDIEADNDGKKKIINLRAMVVWVGKKNEDGMYRTGLEIIRISADDYEILTKNIQRLSKDDKE